ncbi:MAG: beta-ketoacyl-[acyl-carrier-protein] synthase family protein [Candidatus Omnitrophica bacterium]|nr:beta-ketoacyl-[acyl-carrier-protein] synthase family protein [Candidatus Omnitrophota bacterium]
MRPVIVDYDMVTAFGRGVNLCWENLLSGQTAIKRLSRFNTQNFQSQSAAAIEGLKVDTDESLVMQMLKPLLENRVITQDSFLVLATTTGEIEILERALLNNQGDYKKSNPNYLLDKVKDLIGVKSAVTISAACSSANTALGFAGSLISSGRQDCVLVVACDSISEFVFSGFSSLMALDKTGARPFDENRAGLSIGEAAGFILLMSAERAKKEKRNSLSELIGWGLSNDANHMTGPIRDGGGLALAIEAAVMRAEIQKERIGSICAHGTGTLYNDSMEMKAFKSVFENSLPTYSIKGATGHTMGAAGLIEAIIAIESLKEKVVPPTVGLRDVDDEAKGWVSNKTQKFDKDIVLSVNAGFGGINAAVLLQG